MAILIFQRRILVYGNVAVDGGGDGHALGAPQLEHRLHVLAEEKRGLDGQLVGQILADDARHTLVDTPPA
jgi:hypothetical protein